MPHDERQRQPRFLAAGEWRDRLQRLVTVEIKATEKIADLLLGGTGRQALYMQHCTGFKVQRFQLVLREVADRQVLAAYPVTRKQRQVPHQAFDQCRLAGAVRPEQADTRTRLQADFNLIQHHRVVISETCLGQVDQW